MSQIRSSSAPRVPVPRPRSSSVSSVGPRRRARAPRRGPPPVPHRRRIFPYPTRQRAESHSLPNRTQDRGGPRHWTPQHSTRTSPHRGPTYTEQIRRQKRSLRIRLKGNLSDTALSRPCPHEQNNSTHPPSTPAQPGDVPVLTTRSRSVHAVRDRAPPAGASHGHPFSRRTSTVLTSNKYRSRECRETRSTGLWKTSPRQSARSSTAQLKAHPGLSVRIRPPGARHHSCQYSSTTRGASTSFSTQPSMRISSVRDKTHWPPHPVGSPRLWDAVDLARDATGGTISYVAELPPPPLHPGRHGRYPAVGHPARTRSRTRDPAGATPCYPARPATR